MMRITIRIDVMADRLLEPAYIAKKADAVAARFKAQACSIARDRLEQSLNAETR